MDKERNFLIGKTLAERVQTLEAFVSEMKEAGFSLALQDQHHDKPVAMDRTPYRGESIGKASDQVQPKDPTALEDITQRVQVATCQIDMIVYKIGEIGARILGYLPEEENCSGGIGTPDKIDGTLEGAFIALNQLDQVISRLQSAAARLQRI